MTNATLTIGLTGHHCAQLRCVVVHAKGLLNALIAIIEARHTLGCNIGDGVDLTTVREITALAFARLASREVWLAHWLVVKIRHGFKYFIFD